MNNVAVMVLALVLGTSPIAVARKQPTPLNWEPATVTEIRSAPVYAGERDTSTNNDIYRGRSRSSAVYAPAQVYTIQTAALAFDVQWTGTSNSGGLIDNVAGTILAGRPPNLVVGQHVQVAQLGSYLYIESGGKKAPGLVVVATRQVQAEPRRENALEPPKATVKPQTPEPRLEAASSERDRPTLMQAEATANDPSGQQLERTQDATTALQKSPLPAAKVQLSIDSVPDGAFITLNGKRVGQTPSRFTLDPGAADITITAPGFAKWSTSLELLADSSVSLRPRLETLPDVVRQPPATVQSSPSAGPAVQSPSSPVIPPTLLSKIEPTYPASVRSSHVSGMVHLRVTITTEGVPSNVEVVKGLGHGLDESAVKAVEQWRFKPAYHNGVAVEYTGSLDLLFYPERK